MTRSLLVTTAFTVVLLLPGQAFGGLPAAKPPTTSGLAAAGVKVSWPLTAPATTAKPGQRFTVRVRRGSARASVRLVRATSSGKALHTVVSRTLRAGSFSAKLPAQAPATYALKLTARGRTYFSWITVPAPARPQPRGCPAPDGTDPAATLAFAGPPPTTVAPGTQLALTLANTGDVCLVSGAPDLKREGAPGVWEHVQQKTPDGHLIVSPAILIPFVPGTSGTVALNIPPDAVPGTYRGSFDVRPIASYGGPSLPSPVTTLLTPTFTVAAL